MSSEGVLSRLIKGIFSILFLKSIQQNGKYCEPLYGQKYLGTFVPVLQRHMIWVRPLHENCKEELLRIRLFPSLIPKMEHAI